MIETTTIPRIKLVTTAFRRVAPTCVRKYESFFKYRWIVIVDPPDLRVCRLAFLVSNRGTGAFARAIEDYGAVGDDRG
jgi:hypothetical protein